MHFLSAALAVSFLLAATPSVAQSVFDATLGQAGEKTADVSTNDLRKIIKDRTAVLLDARPPMEFAVSHIPGAANVAPQPGRPAQAVR